MARTGRERQAVHFRALSEFFRSLSIAIIAVTMLAPAIQPETQTPPAVFVFGALGALASILLSTVYLRNGHSSGVTVMSAEIFIPAAVVAIGVILISVFIAWFTARDRGSDSRDQSEDQPG